MVNVSEIGSQCDIVIQGKYPLFSQTHFDQTLINDEFERQIDTKNNNQVYYQKGDVIIFSNFQTNTITLRLFNTISIQTKYNEFSVLLAKLSFKPEAIAIMGGNFTTFVTGNGSPQTFLNKFFNEKSKPVLSEHLNITPTILSLVVANSNVKDVDMQVRMEPLNSSPQDSLYLEFVFRTTTYDAFNDFISKFGAEFIQEFVEKINGIK